VADDKNHLCTRTNSKELVAVDGFRKTDAYSNIDRTRAQYSVLIEEDNSKIFKE
jgi:hypothetical protein